MTYDSLLNANLKVADIVSALLTTQTANNGLNQATTALSSVSPAMASVTKTITPKSLIDAGPYSNMTVGQKPKTGATVSVLDILSAAAQLANGTNQIAANVNLSLPGIASVTLMATVGERPVGTSWVTVGSAGASAHTAQTRILLQIQLVGSGSVSVVNLPIYVQIAAGTATLNSVACGYPNIANSTVQLGESRHHSGDGPRTCDDGEHIADQRQFQLRRYSGADQEGQ